MTACQNDQLCACAGDLDAEHRFACLMLAHSHIVGIAPEGAVIQLAGEYFDFITAAQPSGPAQLFVIENRDEPQDSDAASARFLCISGSWIYYAAERYAYRFRSFDEAAEAVVKFAPELGGDMTIVPMPLGTELF